MYFLFFFKLSFNYFKIYYLILHPNEIQIIRKPKFYFIVVTFIFIITIFAFANHKAIIM